MKQEAVDEKFMQAIIEEAKRRGLVASATCKYCGETFLQQELDYVLAHKEVCSGRRKNS
jgi:hypothetical protein